MKYSVIIPHYNSKGLVKRTIDSIPKRSDIEIIIVDDYSTERSIDILAKDLDYRHVKFVLGNKKLTTGGARNEGLNIALGDYILFSDSDDLFVKDAFDIFDEAINNYPSDYFMFKVTSFIEETGEPGTRHCYLEKSVYNKVGREMFLNNKQPVAKLITKTLINKFNIKFSNTIGGDDMLFCAQVALYANSPIFISKVVYEISQNMDSVMNSPNPSIYNSFFKEETKRLKFIKSFDITFFNKYVLKNNRILEFYYLKMRNKNIKALLDEYLKIIPVNIRLFYSILFIPYIIKRIIINRKRT